MFKFYEINIMSLLLHVCALSFGEAFLQEIQVFGILALQEKKMKDYIQYSYLFWF